MKWAEGTFEWISKLSYDYIIVFIFIVWFVSGNKKRALILFTGASMETNLKKLLAVVYAEGRPFMLGHFPDCFCIWGNPSGHVSGFVFFYFTIIYYYIMHDKIKNYLKVLIFSVVLFLGIWLAMSRFYFATHHINHLVLGWGQGYFFFSLVMVVDRSILFDRLFNMHNYRYVVKKNNFSNQELRTIGNWEDREDKVYSPEFSDAKN